MNVNVGVMGHVDSGKTSLVGALSTCLSTCALDKHPQSKARGITLDLGFSSFRIALSALKDRRRLSKETAVEREPSTELELQIDDKEKKKREIQFTLVDCPGHASLIRTIIGATQIIDVFLLVVDVTKGIQTQTAECLVLAQVSPCTSMLVVLNKVDLLAQGKEREYKVEKLKKMIHKVLDRTKFKNCRVVTAAAKPGGGKDVTESKASPVGSESVVDNLIDILPRKVVEERLLSSHLSSPPPSPSSSSSPLVYAVDHCFGIKGQGTVMTGTILQGTMRTNQLLHIPKLGVDRKVKSMQVFKQPVDQAYSGERVAVCITQLDPKSIERDYLCEPAGGDSSSSPSSGAAAGAADGKCVIRTFDVCVARANKIAFFKENIASGSKIHVTLGYTTVLAEVTFFTPPPPPPVETEAGEEEAPGHFDLNSEFMFLPELEAESLSMDVEDRQSQIVYVLMVFDKPVTCPANTAYIASRLDLDVHTKQCRLAFHGSLVHLPQLDAKLEHTGTQSKRNATQHQAYLKQIKVYKVKSKQGKVERVEKGNPNVCIASGFFKKDSDITRFLGLKVFPTQPTTTKAAARRPEGTLVSTFGKSGKVKVEFDIPQPVNTGLELCFKKYLFQ